jgi:hypothetical protein
MKIPWSSDGPLRSARRMVSYSSRRNTTTARRRWLKNAIERVYPEWNRKAAAFVSYGGTMGAQAVQLLPQNIVELHSHRFEAPSTSPLRR